MTSKGPLFAQDHSSHEAYLICVDLGVRIDWSPLLEVSCCFGPLVEDVDIASA